MSRFIVMFYISPGVFVNQTRRDAMLAANGASRDRSNLTTPWEYFGPLLGAWRTGLRHGVPQRLVSEWQLRGEDSDLQVFCQLSSLVVSPEDQADLRPELSQLEACGVNVIVPSTSMDWYDVVKRPQLDQQLWQKIAVSGVPLEVVQPLPPRAGALPVATPLHLGLFELNATQPTGATSQVLLATNSFLWAGKRSKSHSPPAPLPSVALRLACKQGTRQLTIQSILSTADATMVECNDGYANWTLPAMDMFSAFEIRG
jgi:hypothetical protein